MAVGKCINISKDSQSGNIFMFMIFDSESNLGDMLCCPQYGRIFLLSILRVPLIGIRKLLKVSILCLIFAISSLQKSSGLSILSLILSTTSEKKKSLDSTILVAYPSARLSIKQ